MLPKKSVSTRILLSFAAVIAIFVGAITIGMLSLSQFNESIRVLTDQSLKKLETTTSWNTFVMQGAIHTRNLFTTNDPEKVAAEIATLHQYNLKIEEYQADLTAKATSDAERETLKALVAAREAFAPNAKAFETLIGAGRYEDAKLTALQGGKSLQQAYLGKLAKMSGFYKTQMTAQAEELAQSYKRTLTRLVALTVFAMALASLLAWLLARKIRQPLAHAVEVLQHIEQGNYDTEVVVNTHDEMGRVLSALATMQRSLKERTEADRQRAEADRARADAEHDAAVAMTRTQTALDRVAVGVMLVDLEARIIYANDHAKSLFRTRAADIRRQSPGFDADRLVGDAFDTLYRGTAGARGFLSGITAAHTEQVVLGAAVFRMIANPVNGTDGLRQGTVIQWIDRTDEVRIEQDVQNLVNRAIDGDLGVRLSHAGGEGFFQALGEGMNRLIGNMGEIVRTMAEAADQVRNGADEISRGNLDLSQRTEEQATSLQQTASSMAEMTTTVKHSADNARQANQLAVAAREQAERGGVVVRSAVVAMQDINDASKKIADIIGVIDEIAFQTNLLALNAAVEAARAGEQGRGFAVVASEVRNLASRSAQAAKEIKVLIQDSVSKVDEGSKLVGESGGVLNEIVIGVKKVTDMVAEIAASSSEQASGIDQVNKAVSAMDAVTQQNAALVEEASAAAHALTEQAANLSELIGRYRLESAQATAASRQLAA